MRRLITLAFTAILSLGLLAFPAAANDNAQGPKARGQIYVTGQDLVYETFVTVDPLPFHGPFQELKMGGPTGAYTDVGPGDPGYVGGRWWMDVNGNGEMDPDDHYFLCPLLGPGQSV
jgi:hypothetical protein